MRYRGYRRRRWRGRGLLGLPFILFFLVFWFGHSMIGFGMAIAICIILGIIARAVLPALFGAGNTNTNPVSNQQPYYQPPQQPDQPYEQSYQPYEQGYQNQPPPVTYQEPQNNQP